MRATLESCDTLPTEERAPGVPLKLARAQWGEVLGLALTNLILWNLVVIVALQHLSSGRAAILGYSMPIFAALWCRLVFGDRLGARQLFGVAAAGAGIGLLLANLLSGVSFSWWMNKHNRHHAFTSLEGKDPDMEAGALVYTAEQAAGRGRVGRRAARIQAITLVPLLFLEAINLQAASVASLVRHLASLVSSLHSL